MSIKITPIPTASGLRRAMDYSDTGIKIDVKYIGVGRGKQAIVIDDEGRAVTDTLANPVAWVEILTAVRIDDYQQQLIIDMAGVKDIEWPFVECCIADEHKNVIAIYGHQSQALMSVSPVLSHAFLAINMVLGVFPAGSVNIVHQGVPFELINARDLLAVLRAVGKMTAASMREHVERLDAAEQRVVEDVRQRSVIDQQGSQLVLQGQQINDLRSVAFKLLSMFNDQEIFNMSVFKGVASAHVGVMQLKQEVLK